jgi:predicted nucleic acid-binding protein
MKQKKAKQLERRWLAKPLHAVDTCVLLESMAETVLGNECSNYLNRTGQKYRVVLSSSAIGEYFLITFRESKEFRDRDIAFTFLHRLINNHKIGFAVGNFEMRKIMEKLRELDHRISGMDAEHLACAITNSAQSFVTIDTVLLEDKEKIKQEFGVQIRHPKTL